VDRALKNAAGPAMGPCADGLPCLGRIAKSGEGSLLLTRTGTSRCGAAGVVAKTWGRLEVRLTGPGSAEGRRPALGDGVLRALDFLQVAGSDGRGEHAGRFEFRSKDGVRVRGTLLGVTRGGTHRRPARPLEPFGPDGHMEGRLAGEVLDGPWKGS
jgi:hypothetical protein